MEDPTNRTASGKVINRSTEPTWEDYGLPATERARGKTPWPSAAWTGHRQRLPL